MGSTFRRKIHGTGRALLLCMTHPYQKLSFVVRLVLPPEAETARIMDLGPASCAPRPAPRALRPAPRALHPRAPRPAPCTPAPRAPINTQLSYRPHSATVRPR